MKNTIYVFEHLVSRPYNPWVPGPQGPVINSPWDSAEGVAVIDVTKYIIRSTKYLEIIFLNDARPATETTIKNKNYKSDYGQLKSV